MYENNPLSIYENFSADIISHIRNNNISFNILHLIPATTSVTAHNNIRRLPSNFPSPLHPNGNYKIFPIKIIPELEIFFI